MPLFDETLKTNHKLTHDIKRWILQTLNVEKHVDLKINKICLAIHDIMQ